VHCVVVLIPQIPDQFLNYMEKRGIKPNHKA
jgi:hypothetical protein